MPKLNTATVSAAVTPTVLLTLFSHYLNRKPLKQRPTAHLSYDEGLNLVRSFLEFASQHTVEELQAFTAQWVPSPQWIKIEAIKIDSQHLDRSADIIQQELGDDGLDRIGGRKWWQWRIPNSPLEAEWVEMKSDANERKKQNTPCNRVMLYIHGGAYYFGSVDEHRYQMQRHARKLKARVLAPRYRLSPQFPFPCGLQDCLATYLFLLQHQDPTTIILAGDSAGGGMVLSMLCLLRNQGLPLPAGGILISPWVDLTHSFPSVSDDAPMDYIPQCGFHHKPSRAWPPPNEQELASLNIQLSSSEAPTSDADHIKVIVDGEEITIKEQIQMYTTNAMLRHPLVSPAMQPTLGGLPPLLITVGGGEILRDEQIFVAHKCANPEKYAPPESSLSQKDKDLLAKFKPTDVQLQVWDDLCHVTPTLSFTRPAKYMYRSIAQFGAWALARAQKRGIEIMDDDQISVISSSKSESEPSNDVEGSTTDGHQPPHSEVSENIHHREVGKAGDPLPAFENHMIRQQVSRHGSIKPLAPETDLPGCTMGVSLIGVIKEPTAKKWLEKRRLWDKRYSSVRAKVLKQIVKESKAGWERFGPDEHPPIAALASRRTTGSVLVDGAPAKKSRSFGLSIWSLWGSKHDEETIEREHKADDAEAFPTIGVESSTNDQTIGPSERQARLDKPLGRSRSRTRTVVDEHQTEEDALDENTPVAQLLNLRRQKEESAGDLLSPDYVPETGVAGKRPFLGGIALPFSLGKEPDTASMVTLDSNMDPEEISGGIPPNTVESEITTEAGLSQAVTETAEPDADMATDHQKHDRGAELAAAAKTA